MGLWKPADRAGGGSDQGKTDAVRVLVVQDHPLLGSVIAGILDGEADMEVCGIARSGSAAATAAARDKATVVVMDFFLPDMSGPEAAVLIRAGDPGVAIVFHSAIESETALLDAIDAGATAYLTKAASAGQIVDAVRKAAAGELLIPVALFTKAIARQRNELAKRHTNEHIGAQFTARELEVLALLAEGLDTVAMANRLGIAVHTIEWHVRHLIEKLGVHSKLQAVIAGARLGLIKVPRP